jgi:hypothetical protein
VAQRTELLDAELKLIDDQRTADQKYLVGLTEDMNGKRSLLFDDSPIFTKSMTVIERISAIAELMVFIDARIKALEVKP